MSDIHTREEKLADAFLVIGSQYYTLARYSAENHYQPIGATLFHHGIEMLLKGFLIKKKTLQDLKKDGHNLSKLWKSYQECNHNRSSNFNLLISELNKVEEIRYPEKMVDEGFRLNLMINTPYPLILPGTEKLPGYQVEVTEIDLIVLDILNSCGVSPKEYFKNSPKELLKTLPQKFIS